MRRGSAPSPLAPSPASCAGRWGTRAWTAPRYPTTFSSSRLPPTPRPQPLLPRRKWCATCATRQATAPATAATVHPSKRSACVAGGGGICTASAGGSTTGRTSRYANSDDPPPPPPGLPLTPPCWQLVECYTCRQRGHLCCATLPPKLMAPPSCANCGEGGHGAEACGRPRGFSGTAAIVARCYRCGEEGHLARGCGQGEGGRPRARREERWQAWADEDRWHGAGDGEVQKPKRAKHGRRERGHGQR